METDQNPYSAAIQHLEGEVSYGTLGIINSFVKMSQYPARWDVFLINVGTIVRNCLSKDLSNEEVRDMTTTDIATMIEYIGIYLRSEKASVVVYTANQRLTVPLGHRRPTSKTRSRIEGITTAIADDNGFPNGKLVRMPFDKAENLDVYSYSRPMRPTHRYLTEILKYHLSSTRVALLSSDAIDFLTVNAVKGVDIVSSHTGQVLTATDLGKKVFKTDKIPFHTASLKLFGDSNNVKPIIRNKPKALISLSDVDLHHTSEREFLSLMKSKFNIDADLLKYNL